MVPFCYHNKLYCRREHNTVLRKVLQTLHTTHFLFFSIFFLFILFHTFTKNSLSFFFVISPMTTNEQKTTEAKQWELVSETLDMRNLTRTQASKFTDKNGTWEVTGIRGSTLYGKPNYIGGCMQLGGYNIYFVPTLGTPYGKLEMRRYFGPPESITHVTVTYFDYRDPMAIENFISLAGAPGPSLKQHVHAQQTWSKPGYATTFLDMDVPYGFRLVRFVH